MDSVNTDVPQKPHPDKSREHLANERTFLAWIRTSIALMGFGFVIVKFSLFLRQFSFFMEINENSPQGSSSTVGIIMVAIGAIVAVLAFLQYKKTESQLNNNAYSSKSILSLVVALLIIFSGLILILYLLKAVG